MIEKFVCKKDYIEYFIIGKIYEYYHHNINKDQLYIKSENINNKENWLLVTNPAFTKDYFITISEQRKLKLQKIVENEK